MLANNYFVLISALFETLQEKTHETTKKKQFYKRVLELHIATNKGLEQPSC
jgi:hypothetical protein